jgi:glycosyltransferase involved in cell wall biosynthesis
MKVLFHHLVPFALAHGGLQTQILQTRRALEALDVEVEYLRWFDPAQTGDILHFFGRIPTDMLQCAQAQGMKVVQAELLTEPGSRSRWRLGSERLVRWAADLPPRRRVIWGLSSDSYALADACVALTDWEAQLMRNVYGAPPASVHVIPNGVEEVFLNSPPATRGQWLVCTVTITERKRVLELAEAAVRARTPLWIIGQPYSESDEYYARFRSLEKAHPDLLRYEGPIADREALARAYREARGFVLLSAMESLSLSALEAAACDCPLLLSRLPWATSYFGEKVCYCPVAAPELSAPFLRQFYDAAPGLKPPPRPPTWREVGQQFKRLYEGLLGRRGE